MANEIELKLRIRRADIPRLRRHPALLSATASGPVTRKLTSIYYDTPQLALLDANISLRVRRMSGGWFQAVKGAGHALSGLHQRMEWEDIIASGHPDFSKITEPALTRVFDDATLRAALAPIFLTEVRRTEWQLAWDNGDRIELALDLGELVVGEKREPISEIELELKDGHTGRLFDLALELQKTIPLELENISKAQRGYAHYRPQPPAIVKARPSRLDPAMSAHEALKQIAWECMTHLQGNQDMVLQGSDIEGVHQMRVALRRLRSALSVFRSVASRESHAEISAELQWIADILGSARDLDVFITQSLPPLLDQLPAHPGLLQLHDKAIALQQRAYAETRAALGSQRYHRLLLGLGAWLENERWRSAGTPNPSPAVLALANAVLSKRYRQLRQHGRRLMHMHPDERHATRIAAKKLRYAAEFFASLYPESRTRGFLRALGSLLDILGVLNDIAVTDHVIRRVAGDQPPPPLDQALPLFTGWNTCQAMHRIEGMDRAWRDFSRKTPFWN
jgi:inorganic triphosphatase YgiF